MTRLLVQKSSVFLCGKCFSFMNLIIFSLILMLFVAFYHKEKWLIVIILSFLKNALEVFTILLMDFFSILKVIFILLYAELFFP